MYLAYFLQQMGFGALPLGAYMKAEAATSTALKNAERNDDWRIASRDASSLEKILALHDEQLGNAPLYRIVEAEKRLRAFFMGIATIALKKTDEF